MLLRFGQTARMVAAVATLLVMPALAIAGARPHPVGWDRIARPALPAPRVVNGVAYVPKELRAASVEEDAGYQDPEDGALQLGQDFKTVLPQLKVVSANVRANNTAGDAAGVTNSETSVAAVGQQVVAAWNDGQNFGVSPGNTGYGYSSDGGVTFTDGGVPFAPDPGGLHEGDPCVVADNLGNFYLSDLYSPDGVNSSVAVAHGTFSGTSFSWSSVTKVQTTGSDFLDKEWIGVDKGNGTVYIAYTRFLAAGGSQIEFSRSTDHGLTWSAPIVATSSALESCTGSRVVVGPNHEVELMYYVFDKTNTNNYIRCRQSTDGGLSFGPEVTLPTGPSGIISNFGSGPAGFNRARGIGFPSLAIDNSCGANRGREYATWEETFNFYYDPLGALGNISETEGNNSPATANPITIGQSVSGTMSSTADQDWFSFSANAGDNVTIYLTPGTGDGFLRVFAGGGGTANRAELSYIGFGTGLCVFTAPSTGTYYFRVLANSATVGTYTVYTGSHTPLPGDEVGRDQRDAVLAGSPDGVTWGPRAVANDDAPLYDNAFPEVAANANGDVYVDWYDHRNDAANGINTDIQGARSTTAAASFAPSFQINDGPAINWSLVGSNLAPNMGDYSTLWANGATVFANFADGRQGTPDSWVAAITDGTAPSYTLHATANTGGSITPAGDLALYCGGNQSYAIANNPGYEIADVSVDGSSVGAVTSYEFDDVTASHTIAATFAPDMATIGAGSTSSYLCPTNTCQTLPVTIARNYATAVLGYSVTIQLSPNLTLCSGTASITEGSYLSSAGPTSFHVIDNGGGSYTIDDAVLGTSCGPTALTGTLFNVAVASSDPGGTGSITTTATTLRDCSNGTLPSQPGAPGTVPIDNQAPTVTVISPNGGEMWPVGSAQKISWNASDNTGVASVDIAYSTDGGATYPNVIASGIANSGTYVWNVANTPTTQARVQVTAHDVACSSAADASDANFTILLTSTTALANTPNPSVCGQKVTLTATVTPAGVTGTVEFFDGSTSLGVVPVDPTGSASLSVTTLAVGVHTLHAVYSGDPTTAGSTSPNKTQTVNKATPAVALTSDVNPSTYGDKVNFTASVTPPGVTGTVTFRDSTTVLGTVPVDAFGNASLSVSTLKAGAHTAVTAKYNGDGCYAAKTSPQYTQNVNQVTSTLTLTQSTSTSQFGDDVLFTAQINPASEPGGGPSGHVFFYDGANLIGSASVNGAGQASLHFSSLLPGKHDISAVYTGDNNYTSSTSNTVSHVVTPIPTTTTLATDANPVKEGAKVNLQAHVDPAGVTGQVDFFDGANLLGSAPVDGSGNATLSVTFATAGDHSLTANYDGDIVHGTSSSNTVTETVIGGPSVQVIFPNGGENFLVGSDVKFVYQTSGPQAVPTVSIYVSRDNGATYDPIAIDTPNTGSYVWNAQGPTNSGVTPVYSALLKVVAKDVSNLTGEDTSDAPFSIYEFATPTLIVQLDAQTLDTGVKVRWQLAQANLFTSLALQRANAEVGPWSAVAADAVTDGAATVVTDKSVQSGHTYWYRLLGTTSGGSTATFGPIKAEAAAPATFALGSAWPNPSKGPLTVDFSVAKEAKIHVGLVDIQGREVVVLADGVYGAGRYRAQFDGLAAHGKVAPGMYFLRYTVPGQTLTKRIVFAN